MQTFLPEHTFEDSAKALDWRRLGKQRVECIQMLNTMHGITTGWANHPAVRMWRGYEYQLAQYGLACAREWVRRGYVDNVCIDQLTLHAGWATDGGGAAMQMPDWWVNEPMREAMVRAYRPVLIGKDPDYYRPKWPEVPVGLDIPWPR